jgi:hypothetical protein
VCGFAVTNAALKEIVEREPLLVVARRSVESFHLLCLVVNHGLFRELGIFALL